MALPDAYAPPRIAAGANWTSPGLFIGAKFYIPNKATMSNFDLVVGQVNGKFALFGFGLSDTSAEPYGVLLIQR